MLFLKNVYEKRYLGDGGRRIPIGRPEKIKFFKHYLEQAPNRVWHGRDMVVDPGACILKAQDYLTQLLALPEEKDPEKVSHPAVRRSSS
jgi:hypothetical protein